MGRTRLAYEAGALLTNQITPRSSTPGTRRCSHGIRPLSMGPDGELGWHRARDRGVLPGDELIGDARHRRTHAISIQASSRQVWPWLVQMGQGRGGFYGYDWLESLLGLHIHNAESIEPALQNIVLGDQIRLVPEPQSRRSASPSRGRGPHVLVLGPEGTHTAVSAAGLPYPCWTLPAGRPICWQWPDGRAAPV